MTLLTLPAPQELAEILAGADPDLSYDCSLSLLRLAQLEPTWLNSLLGTPNLFIPELNAALCSSQQQLLLQPSQQAEEQRCLKRDVHLHLLPLPTALSISCCLWLHPSISEVRTRHSRRLVTVTGTVVRTGVVNVREWPRLVEGKK